MTGIAWLSSVRGGLTSTSLINCLRKRFAVLETEAHYARRNFGSGNPYQLLTYRYRRTGVLIISNSNPMEYKHQTATPSFKSLVVMYASNGPDTK